MELCIPISVLGEVSAICFDGKKHSVEELHDLIDFLDRYRLKFLYPNQLVAEACSNLYSSELRDNRMSPTDLVHLGYAMAYNVDFLITTDSVLIEYRMPAEFKLKVLHPKDAMKRFL